jgi:CheY-like chemotaxis protein
MKRPIVIVEDNRDDLFLIIRRITRAGLTNPIANFFDTGDAITYFERVLASAESYAVPCALFTDIKLLSGEGFEIIEWARKQPRLSDLKIFVLTGSEDPGYAKRAAELKVDGFFLKFPPREKFVDMLAKIRGI